MLDFRKWRDRSGQRVAVIRASFDVRPDDLVYAIADAQNDGWREKDITAAEVERIVRERVRSRGQEGLDWWSESVTPSADSIALARRLFPELNFTDL